MTKVRDMLPEQLKEYRHARYLINKEKIKQRSREYRKNNIDKARAGERRYFQEHREERNKKSAEYRKANLKQVQDRIRIWQSTHRDYRSASAKAENKKLRLEVLSAYGSVCACCAEHEQRFLTVSYANEDGRKLLKGLKGGIPTYKKIIALGFPSDLKLLCHNCSKARHFNGGFCPHEKIVASPSEDRAVVLKEYGGACSCCGESIAAFLNVDHTNDDGAEHRKTVGTEAINRWLILNGFPKEGFRLLCFNCNCGRYFNQGICPHKESA